MNQLTQEVQQFINQIDGNWGVYAKYVGEDSPLVAINQDVEFPAASLAKIPIAIHAFSQVDQGKIELESPIPLSDTLKLGGAGILQELHEGLNLNLQDVLRMLLIVSDNTAAKLLISRFTPQAINQYLQTIGMKATQLKIEGDTFGYGMTTPQEMAVLLEGVLQAAYFKRELSSQMLEILKRSHTDLGIRRYLPHDRYDEDKKLEVASKGGNLPGVRSEAAIVFAKKPYMLSIMSKDLSDESYKPDHPGLLAIARIAEVIYQSCVRQE